MKRNKANDCTDDRYCCILNVPVRVTVLPTLSFTVQLKVPVSRPPVALIAVTVTVPEFVEVIKAPPFINGSVKVADDITKVPTVLALNDITAPKYFAPFLAVMVVFGVDVLLKLTVSKLVVDIMCVVSSNINDTLPALVTVVVVPVVDMVWPGIFSQALNKNKPANINKAQAPDLSVSNFFIIL